MTSKMAEEPPSVELPPGNVSLTVKLINPVNFGPAILRRFMAPPVEDLETFKTSPSLSFLLEHPSGRKLVWDLGIRKDYDNYAPSITGYLPTTKYNIEVQHNVADILVQHGVSLEEIEAIIWRRVGKVCREIILADSTQSLALGSHWRPVFFPCVNRSCGRARLQGCHVAGCAGESKVTHFGKRLQVCTHRLELLPPA